MIYAVPKNEFSRMQLSGDIDTIQKEIAAEDENAIQARIQSGQLVEANSASRYPEGQRDLCYCCGDEVTPFHWRDRAEGPKYYFTHMTNSMCINRHPANRGGVHQS